ncbi:sulfotransferase [Cobetia sp. MMG027]|uniref:sulfotransferase family protein n=1 Tax=Cobetia sp. MMG027 TaxID=3021980 RepID=UPI0022FE2639|nr:sulfotransferase [Cobetia sp. MMG027]MDA5562759.1 sulfotransferase [Cobetia sp. MMG027]
MIIKSLVKHNVKKSKYIEHYIKRGYNTLPSYFSKPLKTDTSFIFIAGCGHSGTTLLAAKLSNHSAILGIGRETGILSPGRNSITSIKAVLREWSYFAQVNGKSHVLEKTPKHVYAYNQVQDILPNNKFIIMIRNPLDAISSLYKRFKDIEFCIERWIFDNNEALKLQNHDNVLCIKYEDLTDSPENTLRRATTFLGLIYEDRILASAESIYNKSPQKRNMKIREEQVSRPIRPNTGGWKKVFDKEQANYILSKVEPIASKLGYNSNV